MSNTDTTPKYVTRYAATINTPGYMPDDIDGPALFDTPREAWEYLREERERELDNAAMADDCEDHACPWASHFGYTDDEAYRIMRGVSDGSGDIYGATPGYHGTHDLGRVYSVTPIIVREDDDDFYA